MNERFAPNRILAKIWAIIGKNFPDKLYLQGRYLFIMKRVFHVDNPQTFNEKLNWLKLYYKNPILTPLADKAEVKSLIGPIIGEEHIIPTLGVWDKFDEINFDDLPNEFVLKSTNGGGGTGVIICRDKSTFDKQKAKRQLEESLHGDWRTQREWVYYDIKPRFIAEKLMSNDDGSELVDYKIMFFNGEPKLLFVASDRYLGKNTLKFDWYDTELNHLPIQSKGYENSNKVIPHFPQWEVMKELGRKISEHFNLPHVRVDFYLINGQVYFGETTFFHDAGFVPLVPEEWDYKIGSWLALPEKRFK